MIKFQLRKTFYPFPVYEFNLPAGHSCPFASACKIKVDRNTGKFETIGTGFRCYAASAERFPAVRAARWENFEAVLQGQPIILPKNAAHIRIHGSGDFFSQAYFDVWLGITKNNPDIRFWAFTKSIQFWVNRLSEIPSNFILQASRGVLQDDLAIKNNLKHAEVFKNIEDIPKGMRIDYDDTLAMTGSESFALLDNFKYNKKQRDALVK